MSELLARLAQRPKSTVTMLCANGKTREVYDMHAELEQAEFDRDLLIEWANRFLECPYEPPTDLIEDLATILHELRPQHGEGDKSAGSPP